MILQVTPEVAGGVQDYARQLADAWRRIGVRSATIGLSKTSNRAKPLSAHVVTSGTTGLILHMSGYSYARRGLCFWLLREVQRVRRAHPQLRTVIVFHEIAATGRPWTSAFWTRPLQEAVAVGLLRASDVAWTNSLSHETWLVAHAPSAVRVVSSPVFSNIDVPNDLPRHQDRPRLLVVFGTPRSRREAFRRLGDTAWLCQRLGVTEVVEMGGGPSMADKDFGVPVRHTGFLDDDDASKMLASARFGLVYHPPEGLTKSGVFAAYASHGCIPIVCAPTRGPIPDPVAGRHYVMLDQLDDVRVDEAAAMSEEVRRWYAGHALPEQAVALAELLRVPASRDA